MCIAEINETKEKLSIEPYVMIKPDLKNKGTGIEPCELEEYRGKVYKVKEMFAEDCTLYGNDYYFRYEWLLPFSESNYYEIKNKEIT